MILAVRYVVPQPTLSGGNNGKSPVFFGPCMFHFKKDKDPLRRFALEMCAGNPKLIELKAIGVDMVSAIYQGFKNNFKDLP